MPQVPRRRFLKQSAAAAAALAVAPSETCAAQNTEDKPAKMAFGLVTYLWGQDWDLPTLLANCERAGAFGVEPRTTHRHGVEPSLNAAQRRDVKKRFADSPVTLVGPGSNERFDNPNPATVRRAIEATKAFVKLSHDCGGSGVKVKPDRFYNGVPREKTIAQIGKSLNELGRFAADFGQQIRLEVHGGCADPRTIKQIMDIADHKSVAVCWNCNAQDLGGEGLEANFQLLRGRFGATCHIHELDSDKYPFQQLIGLLQRSKYQGWLLLEASSRPKDRVAALAQQRQLFEQMLAKARG